MIVDTKIASKAIAMGLKMVIQKLIYHNQATYVRNRYNGEGNHLVGD